MVVTCSDLVNKVTTGLVQLLDTTIASICIVLSFVDGCHTQNLGYTLLAKSVSVLDDNN